MFRNRWQRHRVRAREVGHPPLAPRQVRQNPPARWISQCSESSVQRCRRIFNHLVNYLARIIATRKHFLHNFEKPSDQGACDAASKCGFHFIVEAFVPNALLFGTWDKRRNNDIYGCDWANPSLFTTYGILVGSPP